MKEMMDTHDALLMDMSNAELSMMAIRQMCDDCLTWAEEQGLPEKLRLNLPAIICTTDTAIGHIKGAEKTGAEIGRLKAA